MPAFFSSLFVCLFFFFNDTATTEIYTLSLHDALPIYRPRAGTLPWSRRPCIPQPADRKSTRLNSSHPSISYAVFCLKKKKNLQKRPSFKYNNITLKYQYHTKYKI